MSEQKDFVGYGRDDYRRNQQAENRFGPQFHVKSSLFNEKYYRDTICIVRPKQISS